MNKIASLLIIIFLASCSGEKTAEQLNSEITKTRGKIAELNQQLEQLESQLAGMETTDTDNGIPVVISGLAPGNFVSYITASATVEAARSALVSPEMNGIIQKVHVTKGQKVSKGQLLVSLDPEVMKRGLSEIQTGLDLAKTLFDKQEELWKQGVGSEMQYLEAKNRYESLVKTKETLESQIKMTNITAPFAGYVEEIFQKTGEMASPGRQVLQIVNLDDLYINTELSESFINSIHRGDTAYVEFPDVPGLSLEAEISNTGNTIDPVSRTFSIRIIMKNQNEKIKPNMLASLKLRDFYAEKVIIVPTLLVRQDLNGHFVYLARPHDGDYFSVKTYIQTGRSDGTRTMVEDGLEGGDLLVVKGFNQIKDGSKLNIIQE